MFKVILGVVFIVAVIIIGPLLTIWALNTLFAFGIELTIWTWLSVVVLGSFLRGNVTVKK